MYTAWSVIAGEIPTATKWNILGVNDAYFKNILDTQKQKKAYTWHIPYSVQVANVQGMVYPVFRSQTAITVRGKCQSGSATIRIKKFGGANILASFAIDDDAVTTSFDATSLSAGDFIHLDVLSVSSAEHMSVAMEVEELIN